MAKEKRKRTKHYPGEAMGDFRDPGEIAIYGHVDKLDDVSEEALESFIHLRRKFNFDKEKFSDFMKGTRLIFTRMLGHWTPCDPKSDDRGYMWLSEFIATPENTGSLKGHGWFKFTTIECPDEVKAEIEEYDARRAAGKEYPS